ncbi:protein CUSTOS [Corythoichthys intestinalis]|uniref:protein CUSTOS n=1 Tax=Corythoichthys intestinalis TaxID=161448 RepID=UPI0025A5F3B8|nr:protein CUSTOS [Corythoichthys intestinalis]XP_061804431.1 protein CUSTOS-like [Nerophis lumbriciformis]
MAGGNAKKMVGAARDSSSSSDDEEELKRCEEAVWDSRKSGTSGNGNTKQSKRVIVVDHEHDGNELQVTQGFQTHVAKKLGQLLDSRFTEIETDISNCKTPAQCEDEGFLLFSTSVPGQAADDPPPAVRRRPIPSSSDSDSEMDTRLKEAAVSLKDLLPSSSLVALPTPKAIPHSEKKESSETEVANVAKKKKKKKRKQAEDTESKHVDCEESPCAKNNGDHAALKQEHHKVKRKKKMSKCDE